MVKTKEIGVRKVKRRKNVTLREQGKEAVRILRKILSERQCF